MAQLWVNLPAEHKMIAPRYQPLIDKEIPRTELPDGHGTVKLYAGEYNGTKGKCSIYTCEVKINVDVSYTITCVYRKRCHFYPHQLMGHLTQPHRGGGRDPNPCQSQHTLIRTTGSCPG